jgi:hypothetical protein
VAGGRRIKGTYVSWVCSASGSSSKVGGACNEDVRMASERAVSGTADDGEMDRVCARSSASRTSGVVDLAITSLSFFDTLVFFFALSFFLLFGALGSTAEWSECATESMLALRFSAVLCRCGVGMCIVVVNVDVESWMEVCARVSRRIGGEVMI